jgi:hypothetical protein
LLLDCAKVGAGSARINIMKESIKIKQDFFNDGNIV